ncbi:ORF V: Enzymatic polyprotein [Labeo rohita]|uniref:ORF V: Enzymatic polyprotein n=1 Tax=Labeo rohita TaxID=84645 RepID=A0ABQ8L6R4_LABRO|nr:ORF V: Enzymatic polyprotein [Labeo rohita]
MSFRPCASGCGSFLTSSDGHDRCLTYLGRKHAEAAWSLLRPRSRLSSSLLTTLDGGAARGYVDVPQVERAVAVHLCPQNAATWRNRPRLPSKACKLSSALAAKAYSAAGQAASALHAMAILQVHQAKALKQLHQGGSDPRLMQELRTATDFALRATKVTARSLGQAGLFGDTVEDFAQQFSAVQKQTEAIKHILPRRESTKPPGARPPSARCRGRPPAAAKTPAPPSATTSTEETPLPRRRAQGRAGRGCNFERRFASSGADSEPVFAGLVCSHRPEGRLLSRLDSSSTQTVCPVCLRGSGIPVQSPPLWASPVSLRLYQGRGGCPLPSVGDGHPNPQLNLDDWLIIAHSRDLLCEHRDLVLQHLSYLGFQVNQEKSRLSPVQSISFLGMELDSVNMSARLTNERAQSVLSCLKLFRHRSAVPLKLFQTLLGHMAATAAVTPLGLLHMRPLQHWHYGRIPRWAWHHGTFQVGVTPECRRLFSPWSDPAFLRAGVPLGQVSRHMVVNTDASKTGWGAVCNGQTASGSWSGPRLQWHINCLELLAVLLALRRFLPVLRDKHVLIRTDNVPTVAYINRQGGLHSRRMSQLARHLLLWSQTRLRSLRAIYIPGELNRAADALSRQLTRPGEWRLHPQVVQLIWSRFGEAQVDLFASPESSHCRLFYALSEAPLGRDALAHSWPWGLIKYAFPPVSLLAQTLCKIREDEEQVLLVAPYWPTRTCPSLEDSSEEGPSFSGDGRNLAPASRPLEPPCVASGRDSADLTGLPQAVIDTIIQARAPSTRQAYALKWGLFVDWCSFHREDPQRCSVGVVLSFLQDKLERRLSPSTLKVYVAAIAAYHDAVDGLSLGKHHLIVRFLRGARRLNPPRSHLIPSWDLSVVLLGLRRAPFEPLASVELKYLSLKTSLLITFTSIKRVGDLHAFSVSESCLEFGPADSHVTLRPRPGYVPKVPTTPFRDQVVNLQALPLEEADPALSLLCPVRALRTYVDRTRSFRRSEQLFVCFGGQQMGKAVSKQRLAHWVVDAITLAYQCQGEPCPLGVRAHSTRSVASSHVLAHSASLADICRAAGWATPNTFARFYNLRVEPVSSRVLGEPWILLAPSVRIRAEFLDCVCVSAPPTLASVTWHPWKARFSGLQGVGKRTTEGERLGYICNPRSLKEGTETLRPLATIRDCAGGLGFGSAPQLKSEGDWPPKGDPKYVSYDVTSPFPPSGNEGYKCNRDVPPPNILSTDSFPRPLTPRYFSADLTQLS